MGLTRTDRSTRAIAGQPDLAVLTMSTHRRHLLHKLNLRSVAELLRFAIEHGL